MADPNVLFTKFSKNIHYSTGTAEEDYPKLDKEFYEIFAEIKNIPQPFNVSKKEGQIKKIGWGLFFITANSSRTNILKDILEAFTKYKMPQFM
ncbi:MAG: hypothetical protein LBT68_04325, partial [Spirochaetales bacterium]|nr:hypothetical protein [Spirochaetales bacterium]